MEQMTANLTQIIGESAVQYSLEQIKVAIHEKIFSAFFKILMAVTIWTGSKFIPKGKLRMILITLGGALTIWGILNIIIAISAAAKGIMP